MITTINEWKKQNLKNRLVENKGEKVSFWDTHYQTLINIASNFDYDDWMNLYNNDDEIVNTIIDSTSKHQAIYLLNKFSIKELIILVNEYNEFNYTNN